MHILVYFALAAGTCMAYYERGYGYSRNLVVREEPWNQNPKYYEVECPVCEDKNEAYIGSNENCTHMRGNKWYKICTQGWYRNEKCGNRKDCFRGSKEQCTEKLINDYYGQRCAAGLVCYTIDNKCHGVGYDGPEVSRLWPYVVNRMYPLRDAQPS